MMFTVYIILIAACFACFTLNSKQLPSYILPLGWLVGFVLVEELVCYYLKQQSYNVHPIHHFYQLAELWLLGLTYRMYYKAQKKTALAAAISYVVAILTSFYILISVYLEGIYQECVINFLINSVLMILLSTHFFYTLYSENEEINVLSYGFFWISAGNLLYAGGTFFQMGLYTYVKSINPVLAEDLNMINHVLNYFLYATYLAAFLCTKKYLYSS